MKVVRILVWSALALLVLGALAIALLPGLFATRTAREELERVLSEALQRPVTIGALEVAGDAPRVELLDVDVADVAPFVGLGRGGPLAHADRLRLEIGIVALLAGEVVGSVSGEGITLHVVKKDGRYNLQGLGRRAGPPPEKLDMHLDVELSGAHVWIEDLDRGESIELSDVGVRALLSNRGSDRDTRLTVTIAELDLHGVPAHDVLLQGVVGDEEWVVGRLHARVGDAGNLEGSGRVVLTPGEPDAPSFRAQAELSDVEIDGPAADAVAALFPVLAAARGQGETAIRGRVGATLSLSGSGLHWESIAPTLRGEGEVRVDDVRVPEKALALQVAKLAGRPDGPWTLPHGSARFAIEDGWVTLSEVRTEEGGFDAKVRGRVSLSGELDLAVDLMPLVRAFGGGLYAEAARFTTSIPVRIGGTVHAPKLEPPSPGDVARGLAGGLLRRALGDPPAERADAEATDGG